MTYNKPGVTGVTGASSKFSKTYLTGYFGCGKLQEISMCRAKRAKF